MSQNIKRLRSRRKGPGFAQASERICPVLTPVKMSRTNRAAAPSAIAKSQKLFITIASTPNHVTAGAARKRRSEIPAITERRETRHVAGRLAVQPSAL